MQHIPIEIFMLIMSFSVSHDDAWLDMISKYGKEVSRITMAQPILFETYEWHNAPPGLKFRKIALDYYNSHVFISRITHNIVTELLKHAISVRISTHNCGDERDTKALEEAIGVIVKYGSHIEELHLHNLFRAKGIAKLPNLRHLTLDEIYEGPPISDIGVHLLETFHYTPKRCYHITSKRSSYHIDDSFSSLRDVKLDDSTLIHNTVCKQLENMTVTMCDMDSIETPHGYTTTYRMIINNEMFPNIKYIKYDYLECRNKDISALIRNIIDMCPNSTLAVLCRIITPMEPANGIDVHLETENYSIEANRYGGVVNYIIIRKKNPGRASLHDELVLHAMKL
jgi:hypothetical protein